MPTISTPPASPAHLPPLARIGRAIRQHYGWIRALQWVMVVVYGMLLLAPLMLPNPVLRDWILFLFWGIGWPFIFLSTLWLGRFWCGLFCPDATLTETVSRYGQKNLIPKWIRWKGWPFLTLALATLYAQITQAWFSYPATLLFLGSLSLCAIFVGWRYGDNRRIWCMYLCPAHSVFSLLGKNACLHFHSDAAQWKAQPVPPERVHCPVLINVRHLDSASDCHACFLCSGHQNAVDLALRSPTQELSRLPSQHQSFILLFGLLGVCSTAILWHSLSFLFVMLHMQFSEYLPFSLLSPITILLLVLGGSVVLGGITWLCAQLAARVSLSPVAHWQTFATCLIPIAGMGIFVGLSATVSQVYLDKLSLPSNWLLPAQYLFLGIGTAYSLMLCIRHSGKGFSARRVLTILLSAFPVFLFCGLWLQHL